MGSVMEKCTARAEKLMTKVRKLETIKKKIDMEMKELGKELRMQRGPAGSGSPQIGQSEVVAAGGPGYFQNLSRTPGPVPVPPSLRPASGGSGGGQGSSSTGMPAVVPPNVDHTRGQAFPHPRATGYRRVFERSSYNLPIGKEKVLAVLSIVSKNVHEKAFGKKPRPMAINPFSHSTQFEGIAASSSLDG